jgi:hypothetical protein
MGPATGEANPRAVTQVNSIGLDRNTKVASPPTRMKPDRPVVKQQAQAASGPSGVVGDSARG